MITRIIFMALAVVMFSGCVSLNSISQTSIPAERDKQVMASSSQWTFLGIAFSNTFVNKAVDELKTQCPGGKVQGILTKYDDVYFFPIFVRRVNVSGFCLAGGA